MTGHLIHSVFADLSVSSSTQGQRLTAADFLHLVFGIVGLWRASHAFGDWQRLGWTDLRVYERGWLFWGLFLIFFLLFKMVGLVARFM